jgi:UDP-glucose 4-epimerase
VFHQKDIGDPGLASLFATERFDALVHLAAQIDVRKSVPTRWRTRAPTSWAA